MEIIASFFVIILLIFAIGRSKFYKKNIEHLHTSVPVFDEAKIDEEDIHADLRKPAVPPFEEGQKVKINAHVPQLEGRSERNHRGRVVSVNMIDESVTVQPYYVEWTIVLSISDVEAV